MLQIVASERPKKKTLLDFAHQKVTNANEACASEDWGSFFAAANALKQASFEDFRKEVADIKDTYQHKKRDNLSPEGCLASKSQPLTATSRYLL